MEDNRNDFYDMDALRRSKKKSNADSESRGVFACGVIAGLTIAFLIVCTIYFVVKIQRVHDVRQDASGVNTGADALQESFIDKNVEGKLRAIESLIKERYSLSEVDDAQLEDGIYKGMVWSLGDIYSDYYSAEELQKQLEHVEGVYYGIGAYVSLDSEKQLPKIAGVIADAPAEEAGIYANDFICEVEGESTYGMSLNDVIALIKGEEGTKVKLTLLRGEEYLELEVERRRVESPTVTLEMLDDGMAYIQILEFDDVTVDQFAEALAVAKGSDMKGLILDLRGNPGGKMTSVTEIARMLLPEGLIVYTEDKNGNRKEYTCDGTRKLQVPMAVLVDMNSASASEVLAGAIKDHKMGTLVGTTTFGKGIVQDVIPFKDGSAVKLTTSSYFTPNGHNIHGIGIEPDVVCEFDGEAYYHAAEPVDNQLEKAKEVLRGLMK